MKSWIQSIKPLHLLIVGYLSILTIGFLLLCIPIFQLQPIAVLDNFFIATSALSTTGLSTIDIGVHYNFGGLLIILLLIQMGGLGYMSIGSFIVLVTKRKLSQLNTDMVKYDFSLPDNFNVYKFIRRMVLFTIIIESIGAIFLSFIFWNEGSQHPICNGIFHSISAFCTAGFSLFSHNLESFSGNFYLNVVISTLAISGALGFIVFTDIYEKISGHKKQVTFTSKIIIRFTVLGILFGTVLLFLTDAGISGKAPEERIMVAFFQSMAAFTTVGFNTYPMTDIAAAPLFLLLLLMIIGASPSGTGGGVKSTTFTALYAQLKSTFRNDDEVVFLNRIIPEHRLKMAMSKFFFYIIVTCIGIFLLLLVQQQDTFALIFEAVSALGTVGLSAGITPELTPLGKLIIAMLMFWGRVGPLSIGMALFSPKFKEEIIEEDVAI